MATVTQRLSRGKTVYCVQVRVRGHTPESRTFPTRKLAQSWGEDKENELKYGLINLAVSVSPQSSPSLRELSERYALLHRITPWEQSILKPLLELPICLKPIALVTEQDVVAVKKLYLDEKKVRPTTLQKYLRILRRPIKKARAKWGYRGLIDPFEDIGVKATEKPRERTMTDKEYNMIAEYLSIENPMDLWPNSLKRKTLKTIIDLALETALRRGEIIKIRKAHISEDYTTVYIPETKTETPRFCPLSAKAEGILRRRSEGIEGELLFPYKGRAVTKAFTLACRTLGITDLHFHDLRHTAASRYDKLGMSKGMLKLITGHKTDKMLFRYLHGDMTETIQRMRECRLGD